MITRFGRKEGLISLILPFTFYLSIVVIIIFSIWPYFYYIKNEALIVLGIFSAWRYGWQVIHYCRSGWYGLVHYPRLRRLALKGITDSAYPEHIFFVIPSYNEEPWVSVEAIQSIMSNMTQIPCSATMIIATGSDEDDNVIASIYSAHPARHKVELVFQRQAHGKRIAMGYALRAVARRYQDDFNSVTIFMDGDSYLESGTLSRTIPFFSKFKDLGALTTNEVAYINTRSQWYKDWFNLKFGQRHILFQSHSFSNKVLTLTGRFSVFRTDIVVKEEFIRQIENDMLSHWLHGKFRFLMGDDKSSWYYLLKNGWNMLYIPDVLVYSLESRDANFWELSTSLPYRWYGNTLRNNSRALKLGPKITGHFIWLTILDQRLNMWTSLVGISGAILLSITKSFIYLPFFIAWVLSVRLIQISVIAIRGHPVSLLTIPLMLYNQWLGSFVKISAYYNLGNQKWSKGKDDEQIAKNQFIVDSPLAIILPKILHFSAFIFFFFVLAMSHGVLSPPQVWAFNDPANTIIIDATKYGVIANDSIDDADAINAIISSINETNTTILLPSGIIDIHKPITIDRSGISIKGGKDTHLIATFQGGYNSVVEIHGKRGKKISLSPGFTDSKSSIETSSPYPFVSGQVVLFSRENTEDFFQRINSKLWRKRYPLLRRQLNRVKNSSFNRVNLDFPLDEELFSNDTKMQLVDVVENVLIEDITIEYRVPNAKIEETRFVYENLYPKHVVNTISLNWTNKISLKNVYLLNAGNHPLSIENSLDCNIRDITIDGAWNKGAKGRGYLKLSKTHFCNLQQITVRNIRHITLQWGASHNTIKQLYTEVDVNFHGGYSHDNTISEVHFSLPKEHPWPNVYRTPNDAHWASPDGTGNLVY